MMAKWLFWYLSDTRDYEITYYKNPNYLQEESTFDSYGDAVYANNWNIKSTMEYVFIAYGDVIMWGSKKQLNIAILSIHTEYMAIFKTAQDAVWLWNLYSELDLEQSEPSLILGDNNGWIALVKNPGFYKWSKHIAIRWHWIRELVQEDIINLIYCRNPQKMADILTKALTLKSLAVMFEPWTWLLLTWGSVLENKPTDNWRSTMYGLHKPFECKQVAHDSWHN